jgi:hypothetical protein
MTASVLSTLSPLSVADWGPLLFPRYGRGHLLAFYADDSADEKRQRVFVVAGFMGDTREWFEVERRWNARLKRDGLNYFRASEHNSLTGEFRKLVTAHGAPKARKMATELLADLKVIIKSRQLYAFCFMGPLAIYREVRAREFGDRCLREDPYIEGHEQIIFNVAKSAGKGRAKQPIAFVFDEHSKATQLIAGWADLKSRLPATAPWIGSAMVMDDKNCAPIQAADLIANVAKRAFEKMLDGNKFEMDEWREKVGWAGYWNEEYLTALVETSVDFHTSPVPLRSRSIDEL